MFNFQRQKSITPISVVTTMGVFTCLVNLVLEPTDVDGYDLKLGRDWFNYYTTSHPDAKILLSDDVSLVFSSNPLSAVHRHSGEFFC